MAESGGAPPGAWAPARQLARKAFAPVERFLAVEAASGIVLILTAALALAWANSPWSQSYFDLWHAPIGLKIGAFSFEKDLHFVINDVLMTVFFFVVGLEIRREMHRGELSELRRATLPLAAAVGGMLLPACLFLAFNQGHASARGWGIPMATDIAFAVGVLALLGKRVPPALRILLLALAVIDDVGAIVVIASFYSAGIAPVGFGVLGAGMAAIVAMQLRRQKPVGLRGPGGGDLDRRVPGGHSPHPGRGGGGADDSGAGLVRRHPISREGRRQRRRGQRTKRCGRARAAPPPRSSRPGPARGDLSGGADPTWAAPLRRLRGDAAVRAGQRRRTAGERLPRR